MAKGKKKQANQFSQVQLPNRWVSFPAGTGAHTCTQCGRTQSRGMMWVEGAVRACRRCGEALARRHAA